MINIAIIGYGYWGPNLVRNFHQNRQTGFLFVCDENKERLDIAKKNFPMIQTYESLQKVLENRDIHAVALATPVESHYELAKLSLKAGKHVLVEKPITTSFEEALELVNLSENTGKVLMVDHTYVYLPAIQKIREIIHNGEIGRICYIDSTRINLGLFQNDVNVLWDLAVHDLSIINFISDERPYAVQATGASHTISTLENIACLILRYRSGMFVHINCSWVSPIKLRHMLIGGDKKMILFNNLDLNEQVKIYDSGFKARTDDERQRLHYEYRMGDVYSPRIPLKEALSNMVDDFITSINIGKKPLSNGKFAMEIAQILEGAQKSIRNDGIQIPLKIENENFNVQK